MAKKQDDEVIDEALARANMFYNEGDLINTFHELELIEELGKAAARRALREAKEEHQKATSNQGQ